MPTPQNYKNHGRLDPPFHIFVLLSLLANFFLCAYMLYRDWPNQWRLHAWWVWMALVFVAWGTRTRMYALKDQDRIIRLEERLRYQTLLGPAELAASEALTLRQVIALRFASDAELPHLVHRALAENMTSKQIKESITVWRADYDRI